MMIFFLIVSIKEYKTKSKESFYELKVNDIDYYLIIISDDFSYDIYNQILIYSKKDNLIKIQNLLVLGGKTKHTD